MPIAVEIHLVRIKSGARQGTFAILFTGEQPAGKRVVHNCRDPEAFAERQILLLDPACQEVVHRLRNQRWLVPALLADPESLAVLPGSVVRHRGMPHLTRPNGL